jgi:hypothetical protein
MDRNKFMTTQWYYGRDADISGPVSDQDLADLAASGEILPTDTIWKEGLETGVPAARVRGLFSGEPILPAATAEPVPNVANQEAESPQESAPPIAAPTDSNALVMPSPETELLPVEGDSTTPTPSPPPRPQEPRKARAVAGKGAIIVGQDGINVKYRMKCTTCGHEDSSWKTMRITRGSTRMSFYCPKCRKKRDSEIIGTI